jgi:hypothetical protein
MMKVISTPVIKDEQRCSPSGYIVIRTPLACPRCKSQKVGPNRCEEMVCYDCGMVQGVTYKDEVPHYLLVTKHTYKRIFYFNERCARWTCTEPSIPPDIWGIIKEESSKLDKYGQVSKFTRNTVSKILRNVTLPSMQLVMLMKELFMMTLTPFELHRHSPQCTRIHNCTKYFGCLQNFVNYDFVFRKLLQVAELKHGYEGCYDKFSNDFSLVSAKIRDTKLRPIFKKICEYNLWPCPDYE